MPYTWIEPDVFLSHGEVDVYNIYPDDLAENPPREHLFGFDINCSDSHDSGSFDLRDVAPLLTEETRVACGDDKEAELAALIDAGFLTADGFVIDGVLHMDGESIRTAVICRSKSGTDVLTK